MAIKIYTNSLDHKILNGGGKIDPEQIVEQISNAIIKTGVLEVSTG